jgi:hypothetical protein
MGRRYGTFQSLVIYIDVLRCEKKEVMSHQIDIIDGAQSSQGKGSIVCLEWSRLLTSRGMANKIAQFRTHELHAPRTHAPQTKILEGGTKDEMRISKEALFHSSWPKLSTHVLETYSKIRILFLLPKSSFGRG